MDASSGVYYRRIFCIDIYAYRKHNSKYVYGKAEIQFTSSLILIHKVVQEFVVSKPQIPLELNSSLSSYELTAYLVVVQVSPYAPLIARFGFVLAALRVIYESFAPRL